MASEHHGAFGQDRFGRGAEKVARFFGTPQYIVGQDKELTEQVADLTKQIHALLTRS